MLLKLALLCATAASMGATALVQTSISPAIPRYPANFSRPASFVLPAVSIPPTGTMRPTYSMQSMQSSRPIRASNTTLATPLPWSPYKSVQLNVTFWGAGRNGNNSSLNKRERESFTYGPVQWVHAIDTCYNISGIDFNNVNSTFAHDGSHRGYSVNLYSGKGCRDIIMVLFGEAQCTVPSGIHFRSIKVDQDLLKAIPEAPPLHFGRML